MYTYCIQITYQLQIYTYIYIYQGKGPVGIEPPKYAEVRCQKPATEVFNQESRDITTRYDKTNQTLGGKE